MPSGFFALLDDIAVLAKASAASIDDVALGAARTSAKTTAVVVDDIAVAPSLVTGLSPKRELPVIWKITKGSLRNKLLLVIPLLMVLSWLLPAALPYLLIVGGSYLAFEGAERFLVLIRLLKEHKEAKLAASSSEALEKKMVNSAVTTDLVLSVEIMLISLSSIAIDNWISKLIMLVLIGVALTVLTYGVVGLLIKIDDIGLHLARREKRSVRLFGLGLLQAMPVIFSVLSVVGTFAMLWVGGHLVWKSLGDIGLGLFSHSLHGVEEFFHQANGAVAWLGETLASTTFGILWGCLIFLPIHAIGGALAKRRGTTH